MYMFWIPAHSKPFGLIVVQELPIKYYNCRMKIGNACLQL